MSQRPSLVLESRESLDPRIPKKWVLITVRKYLNNKIDEHATESKGKKAKHKSSWSGLPGFRVGLPTSNVPTEKIPHRHVSCLGFR